MRLSGRNASSHTQRWTPRHRVVLLSLIAVNIGAFVAQYFVQAYQPQGLTDYLGLSYRGIDHAYAWQFFSAMFLHAGLGHFAANLIVLYLLGRDVESIFGQRHFLCLYFCGAVAGELGHLFFMPASAVLFGASGGVAAVVIAFATILPELELGNSFFFILPLRLKAKHCAGAMFLGALVLLVFDRRGIVGHSAWLGGGSAGWLYAHLLGFGPPSFVQRVLQQRRARIERRRQMSPEQFITEEVDPLLEKISRNGVASLSRRERRTLEQARAKMSQEQPR